MSGTVINPDGRMRFDGLEAHLSAAVSETQEQIFFDVALSHSGGQEVPDVGDIPDTYIPLAILDENNRLLEIVHLITYSRGATSGTIRRGEEGTNPRPHPQGAAVVHAATIQDFLNVQDHAMDPQPHKPFLEGMINSIADAHITAHEQDPTTDPHPVYVRKDNSVVNTMEVTGNLIVRVGARLVVRGDLVIEGRLLINGYEVFIGPVAPKLQPDNLVWIQTVT